MNKELVKIQEASEKIMKAYPDKRSSFVADVQKAEADLQKVKGRLEAAEDINEYDNVTEEIKRAELVVKFAKTALGKLDSAPRMAESEYNSAVETCTGIMDKAAAEYRKKTVALMEQLKAVKDEYLAISKDVNNTLVSLDNAANVLQSKYPYKEYKRVNMPSEFKKDPNAWREFAVRYDNGRPCALATDKQSARTNFWERPSDPVLYTAWCAIDRAYD